MKTDYLVSTIIHILQLVKGTLLCTNPIKIYVCFYFFIEVFQIDFELRGGTMI